MHVFASALAMPHRADDENIVWRNQQLLAFQPGGASLPEGLHAASTVQSCTSLGWT